MFPLNSGSTCVEKRWCFYLGPRTGTAGRRAVLRLIPSIVEGNMTCLAGSFAYQGRGRRQLRFVWARSGTCHYKDRRIHLDTGDYVLGMNGMLESLNWCK